MFRIKNADEAQAVAHEMCRRHPELVSAIGPRASARDVAIKILLTELQMGSPSLSPDRREGTTTASPGANVSAIPFHTGDSSPATVRQTSSSPNAQHRTQQHPESATGVSDDVSNRKCAYCNEPATRYCKETGRRHETPGERAERQWRTIFRQVSLASRFVNSARLAKPNTCVEEFAVELDLDNL